MKKIYNGFTLLEVLISITILALILAVIMGAMRLGSKAWETGNRKVEEIQRERISFDLLAEDIKSIYRLEKSKIGYLFVL